MEANATIMGAKKKRKNVSAHSRQEAWGTSVIDRISEQLRRELLGLRGFSSQNIRNMRSFYEILEAIYNLLAIGKQITKVLRN